MYSFQAFQNIFKIQEFIWITSKKITIPLSLINFFAVFWNQANRTLTILLTALKLLAPLNITEQKHYTFFSSSIFLVFGVSFFQINSKIIETIEIIIKSLTFLERYWDELTFFPSDILFTLLPYTSLKKSDRVRVDFSEHNTYFSKQIMITLLSKKSTCYDLSIRYLQQKLNLYDKSA